MKLYKALIAIFILILMTGCSTTNESEDEVDTSNSFWKTGKVGLFNYIENGEGNYTIPIRNGMINSILVKAIYLYKEDSTKNNLLSEEIELASGEKLDINIELDVCNETSLEELSVQIDYMDIETGTQEIYTGHGNKYFINCE